MNWEERWQAGDTGWEKGEAAPPLVEFLDREQIVGRVLVPGCGSGNEVRAIAAQNPEITIGIDIAPTALKTAKARLKGVKRVDLVEADILELPERLIGTFDWVVEHTCFCAIEPEERANYVKSIGRLLRPGGSFLGIFYLNPEKVEGPPFGVNPEMIDDYFEESFELIEKWIPEVGFPSRLGREEMRWYRRK